MGRKKNKRSVSLSEFNGDHGTGTSAAKSGTVLEQAKTDDGRNPNKMARRKRINRIEEMSKRNQLSMRQYQAGIAIQEAWCAVQTLSSGGELKERVQASPKPDATVARQVDASSQLKFVMDPVPSAMRYVIEHVCWHNQPLYTADAGRKHGSAKANLYVALDLVANRLRY